MNDWFEAEQRVERSHELFESGRLEDALRELRAALRVNPYQGEWHYYMGLTLEQMGRHAQALECFERALEHAGEDGEILTRLGVGCLRVDRCRRAIDALDRAQRLDPDNVETYVHRIEAHARLDDHEQAELMFYLACQVDDACGEAYFQMAESLLARGDLPRAVDCLKRTRALEPTHPLVHARLARAYRARGLARRAQRYYLIQLRFDPGDTDTIFELGDLLLAMGRRGEAMEKFRRAIEQDPTRVEAHFRLGEMALESGHDHSAQAALELVLRLDPSRPRAHQHLATIAMRRHRHDDARRHLSAELDQPRRRADGDETVERELAGLLLDARMPSAAAAVLRRLLLERPAEARLHHQLAVALFLDDQIEAGIRSCRRAVRHEPTYLLAMHNVALAHLRLGEHRRAQYWVRRALRVFPRDGRMRQLRARLAFAAVRRRLCAAFGRAAASAPAIPR